MHGSTVLLQHSHLDRVRVQQLPPPLDVLDPRAPHDALVHTIQPLQLLVLVLHERRPAVLCGSELNRRLVPAPDASVWRQRGHRGGGGGGACIAPRPPHRSPGMGADRVAHPNPAASRKVWLNSLP